MLNFFSVIGKNFIILVRSKLGAIMIVLAPLLIVLLVSLAFSSSSLQGVKVGVYSDSYSELTESLLNGFEEQGFIVEKTETRNGCIDSVRSGFSQICVVFPADLSSEGNADPVVFHVDHSRINLAYSLINEIDSKISSESDELGITLANTLIRAIQDVKDSLPEQKNIVEEGKDSVESIESVAESIEGSTFDLNGTIESLNTIKTSLAAELGDDDSRVTDLTDIIADLEDFDSSSSDIADSAESIQDKSSDSIEKLNEINNNLDELINSLNDVKIVEATNIISPIRTEIESVNKEDSLNSGFLFPTLVTLTILFGSVILGSTLIIREKKTKAYLRNFITSTREITFLFANYLTVLLIVLIQLLILFAGAIYLLNMPDYNVLLNTFIVIIISSSIFIFLGMLIGYLFKSEETSVLGSISIASLLMFFSNAIIPIEAITGSLRSIAAFNPVVITDSVLKRIILFNANLNSVTYDIILLGAFVLGLFALTFIAMELNKRRI